MQPILPSKALVKNDVHSILNHGYTMAQIPMRNYDLTLLYRYEEPHIFTLTVNVMYADL